MRLHSIIRNWYQNDLNSPKSSALMCVTVDLSVDFHLIVWAMANVAAFAYYYSFASARINPDFQNQLHCISGVILCNRPLFGTLMSGFGGAVVLAVARRARDSLALTVLLVLMFCALVSVVHYDVRDHRSIHFTSLGVLVVVGTLFVISVGLQPDVLCNIYYGITIAFVFLLLFNVTYTRWVPPFMTIQALMEMAWVVGLGVCVLVYAFGD